MDIFSPLPQAFFAQPTLTVAKELLGHYLMVTDPNKGILPFRIVETEAYTEDDPACHAYNRKKGRAAMLYESPGLAYVYLIYGMYHCLNVVTEAKGTGSAVLFRAIEPPETLIGDYKTHGPGRLCKALGITIAHNKIDLTSAESPLFIAQNPLPPGAVIQTTRIGITKAKDYPWRFYLLGNPHISQRDKQAEQLYYASLK